MKEEHIEIIKTARYFVAGNLSKDTRYLWIVCHGYGQLARYFLKKFEGIVDSETALVAPEGLHRFYWEKFSGKVVASWMTKEDRENDIKDYVNYLNLVLERTKNVCSENVQVNILGFSQGTATVCRWILQGNVKPKNLVLWAGAFPHDMSFETDKQLFSYFKTWLVLGNQDEFMEYIKIEEYKAMLNQNKFPHEFVTFEGKHTIDATTLKEINKRIKML